MNFGVKHTFFSCCIGYVTQAIVNNLMPLLFVTFSTVYKISLDKIGLLITINFVLQMTIDFVAAKYIHKVGYREAIVFAHIMATAGLVIFGVAPFISPGNIYPMLVMSIVFYAIGGGLIEVLISPMVEALPMKNKEGTMSLLHSFYSWGHVLVILLSVLYFYVIGMDRWMYLPILWAIIPFLNALLLMKVPIYIYGEEGSVTSMRSIFTKRIFWIFAVLMVCAGASELAMAQWSSYYAEIGLNVSKTEGDLLGPCMFAVFMGISRVLYSKLSDKIKLSNSLIICSALCILCYCVATLVKNPLIAIWGCAICGFSVGIMWPGVYSLAAKDYPQGGTMMFALLALGGDIGCTLGPGIVGYVSEALGGTHDSIKKALLLVIAFPIIMIVMLMLDKYRIKKEPS